MTAGPDFKVGRTPACRNFRTALASALALLLLTCPVTAATPAGNEPKPAYRGAGLCQFALENYVLPPQVEGSINQVVQRLLSQHRAIFNFQARPDFRLHMRIFGRFEDYARFTVDHQVKVPGLRRSGLTNLAGYYSGRTKELVTWRQQIGSNFGNVLLHEASHAIMDAHFEPAPQWLLEGCAEYFAYPKDMQDAGDVRSLRTRWGLLNLWLIDRKLDPLPAFLDFNQRDWDRLDIDRAYITSWSVFQFLASTELNRTILRTLLAERGASGTETTDQNCARRVDAAYPGGLKRLESDWHTWVTQTGRRLFPERDLDRLRELDRRREQRLAR